MRFSIFACAIAASITSAVESTAATLMFGGEAYHSTAAPPDYFTANPIRVGDVRTYRFYSDVCSHLYYKGLTGYDGPLTNCQVTISTPIPSPFFTFSMATTLDQATGQDIQLFTVTFAPTYFTQDPDILFTDTLVVLDYDFGHYGNEDYMPQHYDGAVAYVPLPASGLLLGGLLVALVARARRKARQLRA